MLICELVCCVCAVCSFNTIRFNNFQIHNLVMIWPTVFDCYSLQLRWTKKLYRNYNTHAHKTHCYWYNFRKKKIDDTMWCVHTFTQQYLQKKIAIHIIIYMHTHFRPQTYHKYARHMLNTILGNRYSWIPKSNRWER